MMKFTKSYLVPWFADLLNDRQLKPDHINEGIVGFSINICLM